MIEWKRVQREYELGTLLPSPSLHPLAHPQTTPLGIGIGYGGGRWVGAPEGGGGGEESRVNLPSAKKFFIAAMLL